MLEWRRSNCGRNDKSNWLDTWRRVNEDIKLFVRWEEILRILRVKSSLRVIGRRLIVRGS